MSATEYLKAQKLGEKCYQAAVAKNEYPYLPVLDELVDPSEINGEQYLGLQQISLYKVVGTATAGRTTAFASNFMPILDFKTEFGAKWSTLCDSHIEEGIHDPIKCYEFMDRFYVVEGNKRVSVLKYFGADSVPAVVTRKVPKLSDDPKIKIYYEFMDFQKQTGISYIYFSTEGGFDKLRELMGITKDDTFTEDEKLDFNSAHLAFEKAFRAKAGYKMPITTGDAMLAFLNVYSYQELKEMSTDELKNSMDKVWEEIQLIAEKKEKKVVPVLNPVEPKKKLFSIKPSAPKNLKVAFVYDKSPEKSVWIYGHELGRIGVDEKFGDKVETIAINDIDDNNKLAKCLSKLIEDKYDVIFTTGPQMLQESLKAAVENDDVKILNCSLNMSTSHVRTYYARMYEAKFISGVIAGSLCRDGKIGYIADYPIFGMTANINAFAMGVRLVNPEAMVYLDWSKLKNHNPVQRFRDMGVNYVSAQDMITPEHASREFGLYEIQEDGIRNLAMPVYNWSSFYEKVMQSILSGTWKQEEKEEKKKSMNYWWGMSAGVVDVIMSNHLPVGTKRLANLMKDLIVTGKIVPFYGELYSQEGIVRNEEDGEMTPEEIMKMDWLCDNIIGYIPNISEFVDEAKEVIKMQGLNSAENIELKMNTEVLKSTD